MNPRSAFYSLKKKLAATKPTSKWSSFLDFFKTSKLAEFFQKNRLLLSVLVIYGILASLLGFVLFQSTDKDTAKASEAAFISGSIRFQREKTFKQGDEIGVIVTLQNTSTIESINTLHLELASTRNMVEWKKAQNLNDSSQAPLSTTDGRGFNLPNLSSNERVEYLVSGFLNKTPSNFLTISAKIKFVNRQGKEQTETNRIFTFLESVQRPKFPLMKLLTNQPTYKFGETVIFTLNSQTTEAQDKLEIGENGQIINNTLDGQAASSSATSQKTNVDEEIIKLSLRENASQSSSVSSAEALSGNDKVTSEDNKQEITIKGQIYIVDRQTKDLVQTLDCQTELSKSCETQVGNLPPGQYSAVFVNEDEEVSSEIVWFEIVGKEKEAQQLNPEVKLRLPFGANPINDRVDVLAEKVLTQNQDFKPDLKCIFEIWRNDNKQKVGQRETLINKERNCLIQLGPNDFPQNGLYTVKLVNSNAEVLVTYLSGPKPEIRLKNQDLLFNREKGVNLTLEKVLLSDKTVNQSTNNSSLFELPGGKVGGNTSQASSSSTSGGQSSSNNNLEFPGGALPKSSSSSSSLSSSTSSSSEEEEDGDTIGIIQAAQNLVRRIKLDWRNANANSASSSSKAATGIIEGLDNLSVNSSATSNSSSKTASGLNSSQSSLQNNSTENNKQTDLQALNGQNITLYLYHPQTGEFQEVTKALIQNGLWQAQIASSYFSKTGLYEVVGKLDNGSYTEFLSVSFQSQEVSPAGQAIQFDPKIWIAGQKMLTRLANIKDKAGNLLSEAECRGRVYLPSFKTLEGKEFVEQKGKIQQGVCEIYWDTGLMEKSGLSVIAILDAKDNVIQAQEVRIYPGIPTNFGSLSFEYEPIRQNYTNRLIIGPVVDIFGNLTEDAGYTLEIKNEQGKINKIQNLKIEEGFVEVSLPASYLNTSALSFRFLDKAGYEVLSRTTTLAQDNSKLLIPNFPNRLKDNQNLKVGLSNLELPSTFSSCKLEVYSKNNEFEFLEVDYDKNQKKCEFDWNLNKLRGQSRVLVRLSAANQVFNNLLTLESTQASNLFSILPQYQATENGLRVRLLTTPVFNKYGQVLQTGKMQWKINGKKVQTKILEGLSALDLSELELTSKDFKVQLGQKYLDLDIDAKVDGGSVNRERNLQIPLNKEEKLADKESVLELYRFDNLLVKDQAEVLQFKSSFCEVIAVNNQVWRQLNTHAQDDLCLVTVKPEVTGKLELLFLDKLGFVQDSLTLQVKDTKYQVDWCLTELGNGCPVQVSGPVLGKIKATLYDQGKEYTFESDSLENLLEVYQKGLDPKKKYLLKLEYENFDRFTVQHYKQILGKQIMQEKAQSQSKQE